MKRLCSLACCSPPTAWAVDLMDHRPAHCLGLGTFAWEEGPLGRLLPWMSDETFQRMWRLRFRCDSSGEEVEGEVFQAEGTTAKVKRKKDYSFFQKLKEIQYGWNAVLGLISSSSGKWWRQRYQQGPNLKAHLNQVQSLEDFSNKKLLQNMAQAGTETFLLRKLFLHNKWCLISFLKIWSQHGKMLWFTQIE